MSRYTVRYQAGPYSGTRTVEADDEEHARAIVKARIRKHMTLPMYSDSYRVVECGCRDEEENKD